MHRPRTLEPEIRFGITVSKKIGKAVVRNRVRRRLRELLRHNLKRFSSGDYVVVAHPQAALVDFNLLAEDFERAVFRLNKSLGDGLIMRRKPTTNKTARKADSPGVGAKK
jgi:ribonuclease P protein component